jgi:hypothetical protein
MSVAAATSAVVAFFAGSVLPSAAWPMVDGDTWWHIRAGQDILASGAVPRVDTWSLVGVGRPWTSQDWLANVILAVGHDVGPSGWTALSLLFAGCTVASFWILWRAIAVRRPSVGWASRVIWLSAGLVLAATVLGVRVQVVDLLLATVVIWACWRYLVDPRRRWLAFLPLVAVAWANLHAGWILLFLLGGAVLVGEAIDRLMRRSVEGSQPLSWPRLRDLGIALVICAAALVFNPNGTDLYRYPFDTVGITALGRYILEWFPATLDALPGQLLVAFTLVVALPTVGFGWRRLRTADALVLGGMLLMAFMAIRFLLIAGPVVGAIAAVALAPTIAATGWGTRLSSTLDHLSERRNGVHGLANLGMASVILVAGVGVAVARTAPGAQERAIAESLPVGAVDWLQRNEVKGNMFNRYEWGGYIGQQRQGVPIFMDGRADVYGDELLLMYVSMITLDVDPQTILDRYEIDFAVYPPESPLGAWFEASPAWRNAYEDDLAAVWIRS